MTTTQRITVAILAAMGTGLSAREAFDRVLGAGAFERLAGEVYDALRASAKGGAA